MALSGRDALGYGAGLLGVEALAARGGAISGVGW